MLSLQYGVAMEMQVNVSGRLMSVKGTSSQAVDICCVTLELSTAIVFCCAW